MFRHGHLCTVTHLFMHATKFHPQLQHVAQLDSMLAVQRQLPAIQRAVRDPHPLGPYLEGGCLSNA